jgi:hypothetical protein
LTVDEAGLVGFASKNHTHMTLREEKQTTKVRKDKKRKEEEKYRIEKLESRGCFRCHKSKGLQGEPLTNLQMKKRIRFRSWRSVSGQSEIHKRQEDRSEQAPVQEE